MLTHVLSTLTHDYKMYFPEAREPLRILSTSIERRRLSDLAHVRLQWDGHQTEIFVKFHKHPYSPAERVRAKAQLEYETLRWLSDVFATVPHCSVVRPIAYFSEYKAVVTEKAEGMSLYTWLNRPFHTLFGLNKKRVERWCYQAGYWLRQFQERTARHERERFASARLWEDVECILQRCTTLGFSDWFRARIDAWFRCALDRLGEPEVGVVGQHPDFHPQNILISPQGITVLDFTSFRYGNRYHDVASFLTFLASRVKHPCFRKVQMDRLEANFLRGYRLLALEDPLLRLYYVKAMLNYSATLLSRMPRAFGAPHFVQRFFLRWAAQRAISLPES